MPPSERQPLTRAVVLRGIGFALAIALGAVAVWLIVTGSMNARRVEIGVLAGLWGLLLGAYSMFGARRQHAEESARYASELVARAPGGIEPAAQAEARRDFEQRLEQLLRTEISSAVNREVGDLRREVSELRQELLEKVGGQLRLERIETTRLIGSDLEALQAEVRQLKSLRDDGAGLRSARVVESSVETTSPLAGLRPATSSDEIVEAARALEAKVAEEKAQAERAAKEQAEREANEQAEREAAQRAERDERERAHREAAARAEQQRQQREARAREERERQQREARAREERERQQREARAREEKQRLEREALARAEQERQERENRARAERERAQREAADRATREEAQRAARAEAERERARREAREQAEREARELAQREARARAEREKAEQEARARSEREARDRAQREEREKAERERLAREQAAREQAARQAADPFAALPRITPFSDVDLGPEPAPSNGHAPDAEPAEASSGPGPNAYTGRRRAVDGNGEVDHADGGRHSRSTGSADPDDAIENTQDADGRRHRRNGDDGLDLLSQLLGRDSADRY